VAVEAISQVAAAVDRGPEAAVVSPVAAVSPAVVAVSPVAAVAAVRSRAAGGSVLRPAVTSG